MNRLVRFAAIACLLASGCGGGGGSTQPPDPPAAPSDLVAVAQSPTSILLTWTDNSGDETGFRVEVQGDGSWLQAGEVSAGVTSLLDTGLNPDTPYTYRAYAYGEGGNSDYSNSADAHTLNTGTIEIAAGVASGVPGMTVSVPITMTTSLPALTGYGVTIQFDATKLDLIDVRQERLGFPMFQFASQAAGSVTFAATSAAPVSFTTGSIAGVRFRIRDGATGTAAVAPISGEVSDAQFRPMDATGFTGGSVQVP
jgi:hypothetical protein